jgi:ABC-type transport system involved in multi-copper enzyme maturation permease subunit
VTALVRAEWRKLFGRKLPWILLAVGAGFVILNMLLIPLVSRVLPADAVEEQGLGGFLSGLVGSGAYVFAVRTATLQAVTFLVILAALGVANEYPWGTMGLTLAYEPRRARVLGAKLAALAGATVVFCTALAAFGLLLAPVAQQLVPPGTPAAYDGPAVGPTATAFAAGLVPAMVWVCVAVALAVVTRNPAAAAGIGVGLTVFEGVLGLVPAVRAVLISANGQALGQAGVDLGDNPLAPGAGAIPVWRSLVVLAVWAAVACVTSWVVFRRQELTN